MKRIIEIGVYKPGTLSLEVTELTDLKETVNKDTAEFISHTTVTIRIGGQNFSDDYQVSRAYLIRQAMWCVVASQSASVAKTYAGTANPIFAAPPENVNSPALKFSIDKGENKFVYQKKSDKCPDSN